MAKPAFAGYENHSHSGYFGKQLGIDQLFQVSKTFHSLPLSEKMKVALDDNHRGYIAINTSTDVNSKLAEVKKPNQREQKLKLLML